MPAARGTSRAVSAPKEDVLKVFQQLEIGLRDSDIDGFVADLQARLTDGWSREPLDRTRARFHYFRCDHRDERHAALLALVEKDGGHRLYVSNVVPSEAGQLTYDEYNAILNEFAAKFVEPVANARGAVVEMTADQETLGDWVCHDTAQKLISFSRSANKASGTAHPDDKRRWFAFVLSCHRNEEELCASDLERWLVEEDGWEEDIAYDMAVQFERQIALLRYADTH